MSIMKKIIAVFVISTVLLSTAEAQVGKKVERGAEKTGHAIKKGGKAVGHKTAEVASKGKAKVVDKTYEGKWGPKGEVIYIDKYNRYYWIDNKGKKHYLPASALRSRRF